MRTPGRHARQGRRESALPGTTVLVTAVAGAVATGWSLLLADDHATPVPRTGGGVDPGGCVRIAVPVEQYVTAFGGLAAAAAALLLYGWLRRRGHRGAVAVSAFGAVTAVCFGALAVGAVVLVTLQGATVEGEADTVCFVRTVTESASGRP